MKIRLIGLGKMGANLAQNMHNHQIEVIGFDVNQDLTLKFTKDTGIKVATDLASLLKRDNNERIVVWLMVPNQVVDQVIDSIISYLVPEDIIIDGGNSNFNKSVTRYHSLSKSKIRFVDVGTSGGTMGALSGACLMIGGRKEDFNYLQPVFAKIACKDGYGYMGPSGAGHFVKMVHNGIEYGYMQAIAEGFALFEASDYQLDYASVCQVWNHGSIIESKLIEYTQAAFAKDGKLDNIEGIIDDSGEGMWMIQEALDKGVAMPVITQSLFTRYKSRDNKFAEKVVAAQRNEFGGHKVYQKK